MTLCGPQTAEADEAIINTAGANEATITWLSLEDRITPVVQRGGRTTRRFSRLLGLFEYCCATRSDPDRDQDHASHGGWITPVIPLTLIHIIVHPYPYCRQEAIIPHLLVRHNQSADTKVL